MTKLREASFKGAVFHVEETGGQFGRRTVLHEYPFRDLPYGEDLGRAARRFDVSAFFLSQAAFDAFIVVCEQPGAGTLIHPFYGRAFVQLENPADVRWPRAEGGRYAVSLRFVEAGENTEPDAAEDAAGLLDTLVDDALEALGAEFAAAWPSEIKGWLDLADSRLNQVYGFIEKYLSPVEAAKAQLARLMTGSLLAKPIELFYRISGLVRAAAWRPMLFMQKKDLGFSVASHPAFQTASAQGFRQNPPLLLKLRGHTPKPQWTTFSPGAEIQKLPPSLSDAVRRMAVLEQVRLLAFEEYGSRSELISARNRVLTLLEQEITAASPALYPVLEQVRQQAVATVEKRLPNLQEMTVLHTKTIMPALVLAWQVNGSIDSYEDIVARNKVRHPCFVPAGQVEVMRDGK